MYNKIKLFFRHSKLKSQLKKSGKTVDYSFDAGKKYILIVDDKLPEFDKDSGSRRLMEIIKLLLKNNYGVCLLPNFKEYKYKAEYAEHYRKLGVMVYEPALTADGELITKEKFIAVTAKKIAHAWLHRPHIFEKYYPILKKAGFNGPFIFDMVDFHYLRMQREAELTNDATKFRDAERQLKTEMDNCAKADKIIVISDRDKEALLNYYNDPAKMEVVGNIHQFKTKDAGFKSFADRKGLMFIGGFDHKPNEDAVMYLRNEVMPLVWEQHPEIKVSILGSNPTETVKLLDAENFKIVGFVDDVVPHFMNARLFIAPLRYGAGIKGKIGQSLEYSLPLVTTPVGAEGFDFSPYEDDMVANDAAGLAQNIIRLYNDGGLWNAVSGNSEKVIAPFSLNQVEANILKALKG